MHLWLQHQERFPCIPLDTYVCYRAEAAGLTRDQLDLVLIGAVIPMREHCTKTTNPMDDNGYIQITCLEASVSVAALSSLGKD